MKHAAKYLIVLIAIALNNHSAFADTPASLSAPHPHAVIVSGKINLFRSQIMGMEIGKNAQMLDSEVLITLDTKPGMVFGVRLHEASSAAQSMVDTLRAAYINNIPVTIEHRLEPGKKFVPLNWVQYGETPKD
ncbi:MAG: hypothetical protein HY272_02895 [Gammaproteobacteria bacterium]|nr:hypothetical protein [Gammaproteobacteria bacterium]